MAYFSAIKTVIIGGTRLVGVYGSSLKVLVSSFAPSLVSSLVPICIGLAEIHGHRLVIHARWGVGCVILQILPDVIRIVSSIEEGVSLVVLWSQGVSGSSSFLPAIPRL